MGDSVVVINHHQANLSVKTRATGRASSYVTTTVHSEPLVFILDERTVAKRAAEAVARRVREQTRSISDVVGRATAATRTKLEAAFARGEAWATRRYSGGRIGVTPPLASERRAFNHSGRLVKSIVAAWRDDIEGFAINYAANRWNPTDWPSLAHMQRAWQRWIERVPVLLAPGDDLEVRRAIRDTWGDVAMKARLDASYEEAKARGEMIKDAIDAAAPALTDETLTEEEQEIAV